MISGCYRDYDFVDVTVKEIPQKTEQKDVTKEKSLSTEQVVDIYLENYDVWKHGNEEALVMGGCGYLLLDMDFDGVCELVASQGAGSDVFSTNRFYRINQENKVEEIAQPDDDIFGYDLYVLSQHIRLLSGPLYFSLYRQSEDSIFVLHHQ